MLTRLYIDNFRTFRNFELKLKPLTLLVGRNGSGKTAVFDVLEKLRRLVVLGENCAAVFHPRDVPAWNLQLETQTFELETSSNGAVCQYKVQIGFDERRRATIEYEMESLNGKKFFETTSQGLEVALSDDGVKNTFKDWPRSQSFLHWRNSSHLGSVRTTFENLADVLLCGSASISGEGFATEDLEWPNRRMSNFVGWVRHLAQESPDVIRRVTCTLREFLSGLVNLALEKSGDARFLKFAFQADSASQIQPFQLGYEQLSDGQRQLTILYFLLEAIVHQGKTLCIDEPDNFLALREIQPWIHALEKAVEESGGQCLLASHHPEIIDRLDLANMVLLARDGDGVTRIQPFPTEVVGEDMLTASEVMARSWDEP